MQFFDIKLKNKDNSLIFIQRLLVTPNVESVDKTIKKQLQHF